MHWSGDAEEPYEISNWSIRQNANLGRDSPSDDGASYDAGGLTTNGDQISLETKIKIFVFLFSIIVVPAAVVFSVCYFRDRRKQKRHESHMATLLSESPDPSLSYRERLSRPVPGSIPKNIESDEPGDTAQPKSRKVSFANEKVTSKNCTSEPDVERPPSISDSRNRTTPTRKGELLSFQEQKLQ